MISRRGVMTGVVAAGVAAALAGMFRFLHPFSRRYPPTPYDDLLGQLTDRETAARLGKTVLADMPGFDLKAAAAELRAGPHSLADAVAMDTRNDRLANVDGWLLPQSLALLCAVAAKAV
jgi:hypothetical protein